MQTLNVDIWGVFFCQLFIYLFVYLFIYLFDLCTGKKSQRQCYEAWEQETALAARSSICYEALCNILVCPNFDLELWKRACFYLLTNYDRVDEGVIQHEN